MTLFDIEALAIALSIMALCITFVTVLLDDMVK